MKMVKKIKFELMSHCTTGWDDDESIALIGSVFL